MAASSTSAEAGTRLAKPVALFKVPTALASRIERLGGRATSRIVAALPPSSYYTAHGA